jgi:hypothetical protein
VGLCKRSARGKHPAWGALARIAPFILNFTAAANVKSFVWKNIS